MLVVIVCCGDYYYVELWYDLQMLVVVVDVIDLCLFGVVGYYFVELLLIVVLQVYVGIDVWVC